ncbi:MAG: DEAD/DEAH box helicase [Bacteroidales bacterium]
MKNEREKAKDELLLYMAYKMNFVVTEEVLYIIGDFLPRSSEQKKMVSAMINSGEVTIDQSGSFIKYYLDKSKVLDLLWNITPSDVARFDPIISRYKYYIYKYYYRDYVELRDFLTKWKFTGKLINYEWSDLQYNSNIKDIVNLIPFNPNWQKILLDLDVNSLMLFAGLYHYDNFFNLDLTCIKQYKEIYIDNYCYNIDAKYELASVYLFFSHILSGNIASIINMDACENSHYYQAQATYYLYTKNYSKSVIAFRKAIKSENDASELMLNPFYSLLFVKALGEDNKQSSINRLTKVKKFLSSQNITSHISIRIYLDFKGELSCEHYVKHINNNWQKIHPIEVVLSVLIINHYRIGGLTAEVIAAAEDIIDYDNFILLQLEASSSMPRYIAKRDELIERLSLYPIFEPYKTIETWEKKLNELSFLLNGTIAKKAMKDTTVSNGSRIIYYLDNGGYFVPRLQKSKDGITWSKGRNIALSTLITANVEGMTDVDRVIASCIKCYDSWEGRSYSLRGNKVFHALINHPLVFSYNNPDIYISIISDTPYIRVERDADGYLVSSNITKLDVGNIVVVKESDILYRVFHLTTLQRQVLDLFMKQSKYPISAEGQLSELLVHVASIITVHSDLVVKNDNLKRIKGSSRITLQLIPISDGIKVELFVKPLDDGKQYCKAGEGHESFIEQYKDENVIVGRNLKLEKSNLKVVQQIISELTNDGKIEDVVYFNDIYEVLPLIEKAKSMDKIVRVEWPKGAKLKIRGVIDFDKLKLSLNSRAGWFDIEGEVKVDKKLQLTLAELLERNRASKGRFVELTKGEFLALSDELHSKLNELDANIVQTKKSLQLSRFSSGVINNIENHGVKVQKDETFKRLQTSILAAKQCKITIPEALQAELRDYQVDGYVWLSRLAEWGAGACLSDDMGLGKTVQSIALLLSRATLGASLIVAPASVIYNWQNELNRFAPTLNCKVLHDNISDREQIINSSTAFDIVITTYGLLNRVSEMITVKEWNVILLDEAHNIKNRDTKSSKVAMSLNGNFRLLLTGTPIQNHLGEIWNLFNFTNPGLLGSFEQFNNKFITPIVHNQDKLRQRELKRILQPFMLRRTKSEVLNELPSKTEITYRIELSDVERAIYENIRSSALSAMESGVLSPIQSFAEITKLRQAACHPALIDTSLTAKSSKIARLTEIVTELIENRHRALVFSQFTSFLNLVAEALRVNNIPFLYLDGSTPVKEREKMVLNFQQGNSPIFLISLKAGGTGLNLTAADYVIHLDPWWNPAIEDQASDRSHRIGQTRPVTIYRLISENTIEEKIIKLHKNKRSLADSLLDGSNISHKLSREDILALLQGQG